MFCTNCGKKNDDGAGFCIYCGTALVDLSKAASENQSAAGGFTAAPNNQAAGGFTAAPNNQAAAGGFVAAPENQVSSDGFTKAPYNQGMQQGGYMKNQQPADMRESMIGHYDRDIGNRAASGMMSGANAQINIAPQKSVKRSTGSAKIIILTVLLIVVALLMAVVIYILASKANEQVPEKPEEAAEEIEMPTEIPTEVPQEEEEEEEDDPVKEALSKEEYADITSDLLQSGDKYDGGVTRDMLDGAALAGNILVVNGGDSSDKDDRSIRLIDANTQENKGGGCNIDPAGDCYESSSYSGYLLLSAPCFYGKMGTEEIQFSGMLNTLFEDNNGSLTPVYCERAEYAYKISSAKSKGSKDGNNICDGDGATAWLCEEGNSVTISLSGKEKVHGIAIKNGNCESSLSFNDYGRAARVRVDFGNGNVVEEDLTTNNFGSIDLVSAGESSKTATITLTILDNYPGYEHQNTLGISEVLVY